MGEQNRTKRDDDGAAAADGGASKQEKASVKANTAEPGASHGLVQASRLASHLAVQAGWQAGRPAAF